MSLQLCEIVLYNSAGEMRRLPFRPGSVNVITGRSRTGKSAIIEILDYCLGRTKFTIPEGVIQEHVAWFATILVADGGKKFFIAKPAPEEGRVEQSGAFFTAGREIEPPALSELAINSNDQAVVAALSREIGIGPNLHVPPEGQGREPLESNFKHSKFYLFQEQQLMASKSALFHRQADQHLVQTIKDTLPYFLGAVRGDKLQLRDQLQRARRELRLAERDLLEVEAIQSGGARRAKALVREAIQAGVLSSREIPEETEELLEILGASQKWKPQFYTGPEESEIEDARSELVTMKSELRECHQRLQAALTFSEEALGYSNEVVHHVQRLESVGIVSHSDSELATCPLCDSDLRSEVPGVSHLLERLTQLQAELASIDFEKPKLERLVDRIRSQKEALRERIREKEFELESLISESESAVQLEEANSRSARVIGRVSLFLESLPKTLSLEEKRENIRVLAERVAGLEEQLKDEEGAALLESYLNLLGQEMSSLAVRLDLEFCKWPYRLDLRQLTVIADRPGRPVPMYRMGSGENYLGCHLITLLALHQFFQRESRPVPGILVLDQPTQVYFPSKKGYDELDGSSESTQAAMPDNKKVANLFDLLFEYVARLSPDLQIIVLEHANLEGDRFQQALVERPWDGVRALVPPSWFPADGEPLDELGSSEAGNEDEDESGGGG